MSTSSIGRWLAGAAILLSGGTAAANALHMRTTGFKERPLLQQTLTNLNHGGVDIDAMASDPDGDWIIVAGDDVYHSATISAFLVDKVEQYIAAGRDVDAIAFAPNSSWDGFVEYELTAR